MSTVRKLHQVDNISRVAQDILNYFFAIKQTPEERQLQLQELVTIFQEAKKAYQTPQHEFYDVIATLEKYLVYPITRKRNRELLMAEGAILSSNSDSTNSENRMMIMSVYSNLLRIGECKSTSFNTQLLKLLIKKTNKYYALAEDPRINEDWFLSRYGSKREIRKSLKDQLVEKMEAVLDDYKNEIHYVKPKNIDLKPKALQMDVTFLEKLCQRGRQDVSKNPILQGNHVLQKPKMVAVIKDYNPGVQANIHALMLTEMRDKLKQKAERNCIEKKKIIPAWFFSCDPTSMQLAEKNPEIDTIPDWLFKEGNDMQTRKPVKLEEKYPDVYKKISAFFSEQPIKLPEVNVAEDDVATAATRPGKS